MKYLFIFSHSLLLFSLWNAFMWCAFSLDVKILGPDSRSRQDLPHLSAWCYLLLVSLKTQPVTEVFHLSSVYSAPWKSLPSELWCTHLKKSHIPSSCFVYFSTLSLHSAFPHRVLLHACCHIIVIYITIAVVCSSSETIDGYWWLCLATR